MRSLLFLIFVIYSTISIGQFDDALKMTITIEESTVSSIQQLKVNIVLKNEGGHKTHFYSKLINDPRVLFYVTDSTKNKIELAYQNSPQTLDKIITLDPQATLKRTYNFTSCTSDLTVGSYHLVSGFFNDSLAQFFIK